MDNQRKNTARAQNDIQVTIKKSIIWIVFLLCMQRMQDKMLEADKIKECALTGFNVSYTPDGNYATFEDGVMTSYEISMTFQELEPIFNSDYTELDDNADTEIGY